MKPKELTIRGLILGALITTVFTAANVYLGLKVGLTFASSIPAAVISMAILSAVKDSTILENNIVQTVASAAGTLSAIIFVLPGLVIVGWWTEFPFWQSFFICLAGGVLGVVFTIPLRRALVTNSDLPYPEGVAAAEVLKVGSGTRGETKDESGEAREGLTAVILGSVASAGLAIITATRIAAAEMTGFFRIGATASTGYNFAWSLALLGAGHLVGLSVGMAMLVGGAVIFSVFYSLLLDPFPYKDSDRLVTFSIRNTTSNGSSTGRRFYSAAEFLAFRAQNRTFEDMVGYSFSRNVLYNDGSGTHSWLGMAAVTTKTFEFYDVAPLLGRSIISGDGKPGAPPVFVMNCRLWRTEFNSDPTILGRTFVLNGVPRTLIGVMPSRFNIYGVSIWIPSDLTPGANTDTFEIIGRLRPGRQFADRDWGLGCNCASPHKR